MKTFWLWLIRYSYKKLKVSSLTLDGKIPDGIPGMRSKDSECTGYSPRMRRAGDWECDGDGHYLCKGCAMYMPQVETEEPDLDKDSMERNSLATITDIT